MFVYREHRHNDRFTLVHVPTGTRVQVTLSPEHTTTAKATRQAERNGGYDTKLSFGDIGQKRYRYVDRIASRSVQFASLEQLGAVDIRQETYQPSDKGSGKTPEDWVEVSFMADEKAFDRIFDSGKFSGLEAVE